MDKNEIVELLEEARESARQGDTALTREELDRAEHSFCKIYELTRRLPAQLGNMPGVLRVQAAVLQRLGILARKRGRLDEAERCYREMHKLTLRRQAHLGDTPDVLAALTIDYQCLGDMAHEGWRLDEAERCYREMHKLTLRRQAHLGDTPDVLRVLVVVLQRLGDLARDQEMVDEAKRCYREMHELTLRLRVQLGDTPDVLDALAIVFRCLGNLARDQEMVDEAMRCYRKMHKLTLRRQAQLGDTPDVLNSLVNSLGHLGDLSLELDKVAQAERYHREMYEFAMRLQPQLGDTPDFLRLLEIILQRRGILARKQGRLDETERCYRAMHELTLRRQAQLGDTPDVLDALAIVFRCLGDLARDQEMVDEVAVHYLTSTDYLLVRVATNANWLKGISHNGKELVHLVFEKPSLLPDVLPRLDRISEMLVEFVDFQPVKLMERNRMYFSSFHASYLTLALAIATDRVPTILSAIQGRKLAALVLDELESRLQDYPEGDLRRKFVDARTELRRLVLGLQLISGGLDEKDSRTSERSGRFEHYHATYQAQLARFEAKLKEYHQLRLELSRQPGFLVTTPHLEISCASLQGGLGEQEGLLLLLDFSPEPKDAKTFPAVYALLIRRQDAPVLHALPQLSWAPALMRQVLGRRGGYREAATSCLAETALVETGLADDAMSTLMQDALWTPLAESLHGLKRLNVVTHGDLHAIPVSLGCPVECATWPGLVFYHLHKTQPAPSEEDKHIGIVAYSATETGHASHAPIPFVDAESVMVQTLWQKEKADNPLDFHQETPVTCIHLAGHGKAIREHLDEAQLLVGRDRVLTFHDVLSSPLRPEVVFLSACLVGQTREDLDGDPLGMVSAFMLRGACYVIAPLVPVSDFHMPLLAVLFHQSWLAGLRPHEALADAKQRLESGEWHEQTEALVRLCYAPVLETHLQALYEGRYNPFRHPAMTVKEWFPDLSEEECDTLFNLGARSIIDRLVSSKARLYHLAPVKEIINFTVGFGYA